MDSRDKMASAYRTMAIDEYGEGEIAPGAIVDMTWKGAYVQCRDGKYVHIDAIPQEAR